MKKIAKRILTILAVVVLATGITSAYFNDNLEVVGNTFSSGQLDLAYNGTVSETFSVSDMAPGFVYGTEGEYTLSIYNEDYSINAKYRIREELTYESVSGFYDMISTRIYKNDNMVYEGQMSGFYADPDTDWELAEFAPGSYDEWKFEFWLDENAGNEYQNQYAEFDLFVDGTQSNNPDW